MHFLVNRWRTLLVFSAGVACGLVAVGVAMATIPDVSGVIHGCYASGGSHPGKLRVINADAGQSCRNNERPVNWSQTGPRGFTGDTGPRGLTGAQGTPGAQGPRGTPGPAGVLGVFGSNGGHHVPAGVPFQYRAWSLRVAAGTWLMDGNSDIFVGGSFAPDADPASVQCRIGWADDPSSSLGLGSSVNDGGINSAGYRAVGGQAMISGEMQGTQVISLAAPRTLIAECSGPAPASDEAGFATQVSSSSTLRLTTATVTTITP